MTTVEGHGGVSYNAACSPAECAGEMPTDSPPCWRCTATTRPGMPSSSPVISTHAAAAIFLPSRTARASTRCRPSTAIEVLAEPITPILIAGLCIVLSSSPQCPRPRRSPRGAGRHGRCAGRLPRCRGRTGVDPVSPVSDGSPTFIAMDAQPKDQIVPMVRLREPDRAAHQPRDPGPQRQVCARHFLGVILANPLLVGVEVPLVSPPSIRVIARHATRLQQYLPLEKHGIL